MRVLVLFMLVVFGLNVGAIEGASLEKELENYQADSVTLKNELKKIEREIKTLRNNRAYFEDALFNETLTSGMIISNQKQIGKIDLKVKAKKEESKRKSEELTDLLSKVLRSTSKYKKNKREESVKTQIKTLGLIGEFQSLKIKANDLDDELDEMERILDKGAIGVYMKQKMGLLLNSQVICSSVKRCNVKDPKQVSNTKIADELFPDTGKTTRKGSYYDKVNKTKHFNKSSK